MKCNNKKCNKRALKIYTKNRKGEKIFGSYCKHCGKIIFNTAIDLFDIKAIYLYIMPERTSKGCIYKGDI